MQQSEVKRKWKRKWGLKQDYIEGYLTGLFKTFEKQVLTNGYEVSLQLPNVVTVQIEELGLIKNSKNLLHEITDNGAFLMDIEKVSNLITTIKLRICKSICRQNLN